MAKEKFLVTGCAGFIGGHMLERLVAEGVETAGVDDFSSGNPANMASCEGKFDFIEGSLCDPGIAGSAVEGVTHIIHLASIPSVPRSVDHPLESMHSSVTATVVLLDAARKAGVKRVVQSTSSAAYGDNPAPRKSELLNPEPLSPYAVAKLAQEYYCRAFSLCYGLDTVSLRYFNVFGPRQDPHGEYSAVIPKFIALLLAGKRPVIFGDGTQSRDFTHVENIVNANLVAARHPSPLWGEVFNIACGTSISLNQLVEKLNAILGTEIDAVHEAPRPGDIASSQSDISKARTILGFQPEVDVDDGLRRTIDFLRAR